MALYKTVRAYDENGNSYILKVSNNQKLIQIHREKGINFSANYAAMKNLSANAYVLYMYLLMHHEKRLWVLSSKDIYEKTPLRKYTLTNAITELQDKGYLVPGPVDLGNEYTYKSNSYHLYEVLPGLPGN